MAKLQTQADNSTPTPRESLLRFDCECLVICNLVRTDLPIYIDDEVEALSHEEAVERALGAAKQNKFLKSLGCRVVSCLCWEKLGELCKRGRHCCTAVPD